MRLSLIAALAENRVIGRDGELPWRLSADLRRFKRLTMGHHLLVGRKTFESIGRPLPGRIMVVLSRRGVELPEGVRQAGSLEAAVAIARESGDDEAFVAGGGAVYAQALPLADRLYLTRVEASYAGDVLFPAFDETSWRLLESERHPADERNETAARFEVWERS